MEMTAFESAKHLVAEIADAQECIVSIQGDTPRQCKGLFIPSPHYNCAALAVLQAAISRVDPEAQIIMATSGSKGVVLSFSPHYSSPPPIQQIIQQLRQLERDLPNCITRAEDGSYIITRTPSIMPLDVHDMLGSIARHYYTRMQRTTKQTDQQPRGFDATPYFALPKGEVFIDADGMRHTMLSAPQAGEYIRQCAAEGKTQYDLGALFDHAVLGSVAAHEVLANLGMLPQKGRALN